ncbi:hypothetical protein AWENTII_007356 [Aspergillus wentii]
MLEDGVFVQPLLDFLGGDIDVERRDPQGRTLFLSVCRSNLGLDSATDGMCRDIACISTVHGISHNPFPQPDNPWRELQRPGSTETPESSQTFLEFFLSHGADLYAVDNYGRNALHHLLDGIDRAIPTSHPPGITTSLRYLVAKCPTLINQPDHAGFYSLHFALRRIGVYWRSSNVPDRTRKLETHVYDLLKAGADLFARDGRGNTVLHYLADDQLGDIGGMGDTQRQMCRDFLKAGIDPNARNADGVSALEVFLIKPEDDNKREGEWSAVKYKQIGEAVIAMFEGAGGRLKDTNAAGQTLLHLVAQQVSLRTSEWFELLEKKGLDRHARDNDGRTPVDFAKDNEDLADDLEL